jgi:K+-transporting ATPase KdpF subunit
LFFSPLLRSLSDWQGEGQGVRFCALRSNVMIDYIWTGIVSALLLVYLLYALLKPERF